MIIGSHGMTHKNLIRLSEPELEAELKDSKTALEDNLNIKVECLSIPRGFSNKRVVQKACTLGYNKLFTSDLGFNLNGNLNLLRLNRIPIKSSLSVKRFANIIDGKLMVIEAIEDAFKKMISGAIGVKNYEKMTKRLYKWT